MIKECGTETAVEEQVSFFIAIDASSFEGWHPLRPPLASTNPSE